MQFWDNVGASSFQAEHGKVKLGLMHGCHDAIIGVLDMDGSGGGSFVEDGAVKTGVVGGTSRVGCDDGGGPGSEGCET